MSNIEKYGETEVEQDIQLMIKSREIVKEIVNFGVTESQKIQIIKLLSLELEDGNLDMHKNANGNKSAGVRARKGLRLVKKQAAELVKSSLSVDKE